MYEQTYAPKENYLFSEYVPAPAVDFGIHAHEQCRRCTLDVLAFVRLLFEFISRFFLSRTAFIVNLLIFLLDCSPSTLVCLIFHIPYTQVLSFIYKYFLLDCYLSL